MSISIKDILVVSDMDGTLLSSTCAVPACNLETIRLFIALGGKFTVATGRTVSSVEMYPELANIICPAITNGGCVIYDFKEKTPVKSVILPHLAARQALRDVSQHFGNVGAMVMGADMNLYQLQPSLQLDRLIDDEKMQLLHRPYEDLPDAWNKVLFAAPPEVLQEVADFLSLRTYPGVYFVSTSKEYLEIMPKGASKASALRELCDLMGISLQNTFALGDYFNDLDLMRQAGYAVAMGNAPDEVKQAASRVVASNNEGGVGQFLYELIKKYDS